MSSILSFRDINRCAMGYSPLTGRLTCIGDDYVYNWDEVCRHAIRAKLNLDRFLTLPLAAHLLEKRLRSPVLFCFTPVHDMFIVTVCSKRHVSFVESLQQLPGFRELQRDYWKPITRPFLYWDGEKPVRIHPVLDEQDLFLDEEDLYPDLISLLLRPRVGPAKNTARARYFVEDVPVHGHKINGNVFTRYVAARNTGESTVPFLPHRPLAEATQNATCQAPVGASITTRSWPKLLLAKKTYPFPVHQIAVTGIAWLEGGRR